MTKMSLAEEQDVRRDITTLKHATAIFNQWNPETHLPDYTGFVNLYKEENLPKDLIQERITDLQNLKELAERRLNEYMEILNGL